MRSSELAHMAGVSVRTLRHYHAIGLLPEPERTSSGYRTYEATHLLRLLRIRQLASLGFSLEQIGPMLDELDAERVQGDSLGPGAQDLLDELDQRLEEQISQLEHQRELIRHIRTRHADPDYPERAMRVLDAVNAFERQTHEFGFLLNALTEDDRIAMGIAVSTLFRYRENSLLLLLWTSIPVLMLSGVSYPRQGIPDWLFNLGQLFPSSHGVNGFIRIQTMGASIPEVFAEIKWLIILTVVYGGLACIGIHQVIGREQREHPARKENGDEGR